MTQGPRTFRSGLEIPQSQRFLSWITVEHQVTRSSRAVEKERESERAVRTREKEKASERGNERKKDSANEKKREQASRAK